MSQAIARVQNQPESPQQTTTALASPDASPVDVFARADQVVSLMASRCVGPSFIASIGGRKYPLVTWWTSVGAALGLTTIEVSNTRLDRPGSEVCYEAVVEIRHGDRVVGRGSAICSSKEKRWQRAEEFAVRSMAATRATGKAYRLSCSWIATMAGLEETTAEEYEGAVRSASSEPAAPSWPEGTDELLRLCAAKNPDTFGSMSVEGFYAKHVKTWAAQQGRDADEAFVRTVIDQAKATQAGAETTNEGDA